MTKQENGVGWEMFSGKLKKILIACFVAAAVWSGMSQGWALDVASIEPARLNDHLQSWAILDARPARDWEDGHIPGARSFSWKDRIRNNGSGSSYVLPTAERLASELGRMGISESTPVVIYGDADRSWGGEGWGVWVLSWLGHKGPVRLLEGGIQSWKNRGYSVVSGPAKERPQERNYILDVRAELNVRAAQLEDRGSAWVVVDTRSSIEWMTGRLPNAIHIPWSEFFTGRERHPISGVALSRLLRKHGVDPAKPVVIYCTAGVRSAYAWMVYTLAGSRTAGNYSGGMSDWKEHSGSKASRKGA